MRRLNSEGSIYRRKSDNRLCVAVKIDGKRRVLYPKSPEEAIEILKNSKQAVENAEEKRNAITLQTFATEWINGDLQGRIDRKTLESYVRKIKQVIIPAIGEIPLDRLTPVRINEFYDALKEKKKTAAFIWHTNAVLSSCLSNAVPKIIPSNPCQQVKVRRAKSKEVKLFTAEQVEIFKAVVQRSKSPIKDMITILWELGGRVSEVIGLKWKYVGVDHVLIHEGVTWAPGGGNYSAPPKTEAGKRKVFLSKEAMALINVQPRRSEYVFSTKNGTAYIYVNVYTMWHKWMKEAFGDEFRTGMHSLRHMQAPHLIQSGWTIEDVAQRGGWSDVSVLIKIYAAHSSERRQKEMSAQVLSPLLHKSATFENDESEIAVKSSEPSTFIN